MLRIENKLEWLRAYEEINIWSCFVPWTAQTAWKENVHYAKKETSQLAQSTELAVSFSNIVRALDFMMVMDDFSWRPLTLLLYVYGMFMAGLNWWLGMENVCAESLIQDPVWLVYMIQSCIHHSIIVSYQKTAGCYQYNNHRAWVCVLNMQQSNSRNLILLFKSFLLRYWMYFR